MKMSWWLRLWEWQYCLRKSDFSLACGWNYARCEFRLKANNWQITWIEWEDFSMLTTNPWSVSKIDNILWSLMLSGVLTSIFWNVYTNCSQNVVANNFEIKPEYSTLQSIHWKCQCTRGFHHSSSVRTSLESQRSICKRVRLYYFLADLVSMLPLNRHEQLSTPL